MKVGHLTQFKMPSLTLGTLNMKTYVNRKSSEVLSINCVLNNSQINEKKSKYKRGLVFFQTLRRE